MSVSNSVQESSIFEQKNFPKFLCKMKSVHQLKYLTVIVISFWFSF